MASDLLNNRYRLLELVGSGGMAAVYRGLDTLLQRQVAIKLLREGFAGDPSFLVRFQREAMAAARLDHPNIVTVHDVGQDGERHYIVMEYIDGQNLKSFIRQNARLNVQQAIDIAIQICDGVGHAHKAGIIHCDIKPQNVLITKDVRVKVTDFGIARALSELGITESDTVWGSPLYFAPEQAAGDPPSPASDVYSIGVVMYEMLSGLPPFQAEKPAALALMHMREDPPPLAVRNPQVPAQLEWVVRKVLSKEPAARYRTAEQLAHVLKEYNRQSEQKTGWQPAASIDAAAVAPPTVPPAVPKATASQPLPASPVVAPDRWFWILGIIAVVAVAGLVPLWVTVYNRYSAPPSMPSIPAATPMITDTPEAAMVTVPDVLGKSQEEAQRLMEQAGLYLTVVEERFERELEKGIVLEQTPPAHSSVSPNSEIVIVISGLGRELSMPNLSDYSVDIVREGLETDGLTVQIEEVWSPRPEGMILKQMPEPQATIYAGDTVTLTVSGGVNVPIVLDVNYADMFILEEVLLPYEKFQPGQDVYFTLRWYVRRGVSTHYVVFVHLLTSAGQLVAQQDVEPNPPTSNWTPGSRIMDAHQLTIPDNQPSGQYQLRVGLYPRGDTSYRLPVVDVGETSAEDNSALIIEIEIRP
ncbi:MAG TPA: Stk1 family PASTA domain-containing Ser/Thr kinase [Chloroflexi bacterium]|nr:Stk1 family PASTA domain-containing Ser/Thr kinase [Chloroflexota bacterium]